MRNMFNLKLRVVSSIALFPFLLWFSDVQGAQEPTGPRLLSLSPLGGRQGSGFQVRVRGEGLQGAYAVWVDCGKLLAKVKEVEEIQLDKKAEDPKKGQRVVLEVTANSGAEIGAHLLRLISPRGVSNPLVLRIYSKTILTERSTPHSTLDLAQPVSLPAVVDGTISQPGELDYYAFEVGQGAELQFELLTSSGLLDTIPAVNSEPQLTLFEWSGSWFDAKRGRRLPVNDESTYLLRFGSRVFLPRFTYFFEKKGRYYAEVGTLEGQGGADYGYQLQIFPVQLYRKGAKPEWSTLELAHSDSVLWRERDFARELTSDWLRRLQARTVTLSSGDETSDLSSGARHDDLKGLEPVREATATAVPLVGSTPEKEPNDLLHQARTISLPTILEGIIDRPGDVDCFRIQLSSSQRLAFEIQLPDQWPHYFSPWLTVKDSQGQELVSNIYREVGGDGDDWLKTIEPKTIYALSKGECYVQIRDLTSRRGGPDFRYRVLIRPQIPHVGQVAAKAGNARVDHINLLSGETYKLTVVTEQEEDFEGETALSLENLPPGVEALPATVEKSLIAGTGKQRASINRERFYPQRLATTVVLLARKDAPVTSLPRWVQLVVRPVVQGKVGRPISVQEIPLMLVTPEKMTD